jgi:hypothetical protein
VLNALTLETVNRILEIADVYAVAIHLDLEERQANGIVKLQKESKTSAEHATLAQALNNLSTPEQAELAALFYSGMDNCSFQQMLKYGKNAANAGFGNYLGGKIHFTRYVRQGLRMLGYPTLD